MRMRLVVPAPGWAGGTRASEPTRMKTRGIKLAMIWINSAKPSADCHCSRRAAALLTGVCTLALVHGAQAATALAPKDDAVGEVIVTANRSGAESLQHVAIAVTAVTQDQLSRAGQTDVLDLTKYAPSLNITQGAPGFNTYEMRGLMAMPYRTSDTSDRSLVAVYLDETPISLQGQTPDLKIYDLERVEILAGPQGTLYGAGSMSGTVRFITAKPNAHSSFGTVEGTVSGTQHGSANENIRLMINQPLIADQLAVRATFYQGEDSGFINNIGALNKNRVNQDKTIQARAAVRWTPSPKLTVDFSYTYERTHADGLDSGLSGLPKWTTSTNGPEGTRDDFHLYDLNWQYDLGPAELISTTSYTWRRIGYANSTEPTIAYFYEYGAPTGGASPLYPYPASYSQAHTNQIPAEHYTINQKVHDFMQEVRLTSKGGGPIKWNVGVFYEHQRRNLYQDIPVAGFDLQSYENYYYGPFLTPSGLYDSKAVDGAFNSNDIFSGLQNSTEHQISLFTDDTWHVTSRLDLTAGVRYFNFHEDYYLYQGGTYGVLGGPGANAADHTPITETTSLSSHGFNPRFNVAYHINDDMMVYAEVAKGFRYGGANQPIPLTYKAAGTTCAQNLADYGFASAPTTFGPDKLWSYSVGEKGRFAQGKAVLNADAYWVEWSDVQTRLLLNCSYFFTNNAGKIRSRGIELSSVLRMGSGVTLSGNMAYNSSRAEVNIPTVGAFNGDKAPYSPRWVAGISAYYDRDWMDGKFHAQISYQYRGDQDTTFDPFATKYTGGVLINTGKANSHFGVIPASNNVDFSAAYQFGHYEFGVFGKNITDGLSITDINKKLSYVGNDQAGDRVTYARPRTFGARIKVKF